MNTSETADMIAKLLVCSSLAKYELRSKGLLTSERYEQHLGHCEGVPKLHEDDFEEVIAAKMGELTNLSSTALLSSSSRNVSLFGGLWGEPTAYFIRVCAASCATSAHGRNYTYRMPPDAPLAMAFDLLASNSQVSPLLRSAISQNFVFSALPLSDCPYEARYCVPFPGVELSELGDRNCQMQVSRTSEAVLWGGGADHSTSSYEDKFRFKDGSLQAVPALERAAGTAFRESQAMMGAAWVDAFVVSIDAFICTAMGSIVIGLVFLVLLRYVSCCFVWVSLLLILLLLVACGAALHAGSGNCERSYTCSLRFEVDTSETRRLLEVCAYVCWGLAVIWAWFVCRIRSSIRLAAAMNKLAAMFVTSKPTVILVPLLQAVVSVTSLLWFALSAAALVSQLPEDYTPTEPYAEPGHCPGYWFGGFAWKDWGDLASIDDPCSGNRGDTTGITPRCWRCAPPRGTLNRWFAFACFALLWLNAFLLALAQYVTAGACAAWFFAPPAMKGRTRGIRDSFKDAIRFHMGSLAFGSLAITTTQPIRFLLAQAQKLVQTRSECIRALCCLPILLLSPLVWIYQKFLRFLNPNAYVQIALFGLSFCPSAKNAVFLLLGSFLRLGALDVIKLLISLIVFVCTLAATMLHGYMMFRLLHPGLNLVVPLTLTLVVGVAVGNLFASVVGVAVRTALQCTMVVSELDPVDVSFVPGPLRAFLPSMAGMRLSIGGVEDVENVKPVRRQLKGQPLMAAVQKLLDASFQDRQVPGQHTPIHLKAVAVECMENQSTMHAYYNHRRQLKGKRADCPRFSVLTSSSGSDLTTHSPLDADINEHLFFHGTGEEAAKAIMRTDFRLPKSHTHGGIYGSGVYMAESHCKAHSYCTKDALKGWPILIVRSALGKVMSTTEKFPDKESLQRGISQGSYDSVCGDRRQIQKAYGGWREFVVYNVDQVLAEYLVWVKEK